ncbi:MAG: hypothetical protein ABIT08_17010 [Bacteroidia bacterium]
MSSGSEKNKMKAAAVLIENSKKTIHHGKRVDSIVKELLDRTRSGTPHEFFEDDKIMNRSYISLSRVYFKDSEVEPI